jgi:hypothetical protein
MQAKSCHAAKLCTVASSYPKLEQHKAQKEAGAPASPTALAKAASTRGADLVPLRQTNSYLIWEEQRGWQLTQEGRAILCRPLGQDHANKQVRVGIGAGQLSRDHVLPDVHLACSNAQ